MKELPIALMLQRANFNTLAYNLWDLTNDSAYAQAAPYALSLLGIAGAFVGILIWCDRHVTPRK